MLFLSRMGNIPARFGNGEEEGVFEKGLLAGKRVLITGGATGLGKSIGRRYVELGADLVICGRREAMLAAAANEFESEFGAQIETRVCDVRSAEAVEIMLERIFAKRPLDILVNNAAGNFIAQTHKLSPRAVDSVLNIVLHGTAYCTIGCGRRWIEAGRPGTVLSILTLSALQGAPFTVPSAMAKAGVLAMTKGLAVEWGPKNIRLVAIAPGPFPTPGAWGRLMPEERRAEATSQIPLRRYGEHIELANLASYLVSDQAGYITGECVVIDGGKRYLGGAGTSSSGMLEWSDEQWAAVREKTRGDKA
jgi:NAD(P)-dependent dehydrogenase (short-subunit alcohol dehydrogenase family)